MEVELEGGSVFLGLCTILFTYCAREVSLLSLGDGPLVTLPRYVMG